MSGVYRYISDKPYSYQTPLLKGVSVDTEYLTITPDGTITIAKDYAWDGCTPAFYIGFWFGTPDLWVGKDGEKVTYRASQVHDVLCQHSKIIPITKQTASEIFKQMLIEHGVPKWIASIYYTGVMLFGQQEWGKQE